MAMNLKAALTAAPRGLLRLFSTTSTSSFIPPPSATETSARPQAAPNTNLFVSGLNKNTTTEKLKEAFSKFGEVVQAKVVTDRVSGYSKGFGFVKYASIDDAAEGVKGMDGKFLDGWVIFAEYAKPRPSPAGAASGDNMSYNRNPHYMNNSGNTTYGNSMGATATYGSEGGGAYGNNRGPAYAGPGNATYGSEGGAYGNNRGPEYAGPGNATYGNEGGAYGNYRGPAYGPGNATYGSEGGAYGNNGGSAYAGPGNATTYGSEKGGAYGNNRGPGYARPGNATYGSEREGAYGNNRGPGYGFGSNTNTVPFYENIGNAAYGNNTAPPAYETTGDATASYGSNMGSGYGSNLSHCHEFSAYGNNDTRAPERNSGSTHGNATSSSSAYANSTGGATYANTSVPEYTDSH